MKFVKFVMLGGAIASLLALASCNDKEDNGTEPEYDEAYYAANATLSSDNSDFTATDGGYALQFGEDGGSATITVNCGCEWTASSDADWLTFEAEGSTLTITAEAFAAGENEASISSADESDEETGDESEEESGDETDDSTEESAEASSRTGHIALATAESGLAICTITVTQPTEESLEEEEGDETEGDETEGDETEGDETEGDGTEGNGTEGDGTEGEGTEGEDNAAHFLVQYEDDGSLVEVTVATTCPVELKKSNASYCYDDSDFLEDYPTDVVGYIPFVEGRTYYITLSTATSDDTWISNYFFVRSCTNEALEGNYTDPAADDGYLGYEGVGFKTGSDNNTSYKDSEGNEYPAANIQCISFPTVSTVDFYVLGLKQTQSFSVDTYDGILFIYPEDEE